MAHAPLHTLLFASPPVRFASDVHLPSIPLRQPPPSALLVARHHLYFFVTPVSNLSSSNDKSRQCPLFLYSLFNHEHRSIRLLKPGLTLLFVEPKTESEAGRCRQ